MHRTRTRKPTALIALAAVLIGLAGAASAEAGALLPRGKQVFFGVSDTGDPADFGQFSTALNKHPALIETFRTWGSDFPESIERWQEARARPVLHFTTADTGDGHELISPRAIAQGYGDDYLIRLNRLFWEKQMRAYIRPLGEPNRCLNVYASYDCEGSPRDAAHRPRWYRLAFRRMFVILHGGGKRRAIDRRLAEAGLSRRCAARWRACRGPRSPSSGAPCRPARRRCPRTARATSTPAMTGSTGSAPTSTPTTRTGRRWAASTGASRTSPSRLPEFGVSSGDDPAFVRKLLTWVDRHRRCKMLVYYQDFGSSSSYRIQNYPVQPRRARQLAAPPAHPPLRAELPGGAAAPAGRGCPEVANAPRRGARPRPCTCRAAAR